jgi:hypothetical protein
MGKVHKKTEQQQAGAAERPGEGERDEPLSQRRRWNHAGSCLEFWQPEKVLSKE